jgi:NADH-quinone oxidoreductase subunit J
VELLIAVLGSGLKGINSEGAPIVLGFGQPKQIGELLLTRFLFPFEAASFLLLVAAVGAVVLARRRGGLDPSDDLTPIATTRRPLGTGTTREGVGDVNPTPVLGARVGAGVGHPTVVGERVEERGW